MLTMNAKTVNRLADKLVPWIAGRLAARPRPGGRRALNVTENAKQ